MNILKVTACAAAAALCLSLSTKAQAQTNDRYAELPEVRFGIKGGLNLSNTWNGDELSDNGIKPGVMAGIFVRTPFGSVFSFQPELLYTNLGGKLGYSSTSIGRRSGNLNLNYIQLPLLLKVNPVSIASFHIGPYASYLINANLSNEEIDAVGNIDNDNAQKLNADAFNRIDVGGAAGVELNFRYVDLGIRYNLGLRNIGNSTAGRAITGSGYNQNVSLYVALVL